MATFKEKVRNFYEKHKLAIGIVTGIVITGAAVLVGVELNRKPDTAEGATFVPSKNPEFPKEKTILEIKEEIRSREDDTKLYDALIADYTDGRETLYVREAI